MLRGYVEMIERYVMKHKSGRAWKLERASVSERGSSRPRSNKYSKSDSRQTPPKDRKRIWVGGYMRKDGTHVDGYYRSAP